MSAPFGWKLSRKPFAKPFAKPKPVPIDPKGQRLIGALRETGEPIWAPKGHSLLLAANGSGKSTAGAMPWIFSLLASSSRRAVLVMDSKDGELAAQCAGMIADMGIPVAVIDDMGVFPADYPHRVSLNAVGNVVSAYRDAPEDLIFASETVTHALIEEPERDQRNRYWRAWPRILIEFAVMVLLKRNLQLATPGGVWVLLSNPDMLRKFAAIEAEEADGMLQVLARNVLGMVGHENWPQHLEAAQEALRIFAVGSRLHRAGTPVGTQTSTTHFDLIRQKAVIFLVGPQAYMNRLGPYYALHIMGFTNALYRHAGPLAIINDEFTNAPNKPFVEALTTLRAFGGEAHNIAQSRSEIERKFGKLETHTIEENAIVKQWFGFSSFEEAERVSKAMGEQHAIGSTLGADSDTLRLQTNLQLVKQHLLSPSELMAMRPDEQLIHVKGLGFFVAQKLSQQHIMPYAGLLAPNPLEGGKLTPDPKITLQFPKGEAS
jgi:type IV secretion system protein VirD4